MAPSKINNDPSTEVPIFLRKTYHMIDTCDPTIACWSEDGETFVVKDPEKFESTIIPQFFKHSKFSSFVRQLNFYSFRKIKYADTIRIDHKLEAETANYWRFRHEHFRRGRPDLLTEIKRMNGQKTGEKKEEKIQVAPAPESTAVSEEVAALKKRIDDMSKNIDALTAMVAKVNLKQEHQEVIEASAFIGAKRKKAEPEFVLPVETLGMGITVKPDPMLSCTDIEDLAAFPLPDPVPLSNPEVPEIPSVMQMDRQTSRGAVSVGDFVNQSLSNPKVPEIPSAMSMGRETSCGAVSDTDFVNELFTAFEDEDGVLQFDNDPQVEPMEEGVKDNRHRQPDPELMRRLGDALAVLPRDVQEMIVERLIRAVTSVDFVERCVERAAKVEGVGGSSVITEDEVSTTPGDMLQAAPLAAATFAALLHHYTSQVQGKSVKNMSKSLPIIPAHA